MQNIISIANDFILKSGIHTMPLKIDDLEIVCGQLGYTLLSYQEAKGALSKLKIKSFTSYPAFTINNSGAKIVLFDSEQSTGTRLFAIAHEIGHIVLKHNYRGVVGYSNVDSVKEREADMFAYQLLAPLCVLKAMNVINVPDIESHTLLDTARAKVVHTALLDYTEQHRAGELIKAYKLHTSKKHSCIPLILGSFAVLLLAVSIFFRIPPDTQEPAETTTSVIDSLRGELQRAAENTYTETTEAQVTTDSIDETEIVYITAHGDRYHKQNCYHIKNSMTVSGVSFTEAIEQGYTACKTCYK